MDGLTNDEFVDKLYKDYHKKIAYFIKSQICSAPFADVEDCLQEVFLIVTKKVKTNNIPNHSNYLGWLYSIASNITKKYKSNIKNNRIIVLEDEKADAIFIEDDFAEQATEDIVYTEEKEKIITEMKDLLSKADRELFKLKFEKKLSNKEIAVILNKSEEAVKAKCTRIKQKVKHLAQKL